MIYFGQIRTIIRWSQWKKYIVENYDLTGTQLKGLYCDSVVAIGNTTTSNTERACVLAEELGHHCQNLSEAAEYLGVTEEFLSDSITYYKNKYGIFATVDNYTVVFDPTIAVIELI